MQLVKLFCDKIWTMKEINKINKAKRKKNKKEKDYANQRHCKKARLNFSRVNYTGTDMCRQLE